MNTGKTFLYTYTEYDGCLPHVVGQQRPAIVVQDWGTCANVKVQTDFTNDFEGGAEGVGGTLWRTSCMYSEEPKPRCLSPLPGQTPLEPAEPSPVEVAPVETPIAT